MNSHDLMAPYSWLLLSWNECSCSLHHGMNVHGCWCVLMDNQDYSWLLLAAFGCFWVIMGAHDCLWLLMSTLEQQRMCLSLVPWSNEHSSEHKSSCEHGATRLWALISTQEHSWHHSTILMSAPGYSWAHTSAFGSSWALMTGHECWTFLSNNKQKMLSFRMTSMYYFDNISFHI